VTTQYFFVLADAELELVPTELLKERCIINNARARGKPPEKILLDASHHHPAFDRLKESERRGRPDIVHFFMMLCMDSDLNASGRLKVFVHTRNDDVIAVNPQTRLPPHYPRFVGLIENLFEARVVPSRENALLELREKVPLATLVSALKPDEVIIMEADGSQSYLPDKLASIKAERVVVIIGGFSKATFRSSLCKLNATRISLGHMMMKVGTVTAKCLCAVDMAERLASMTVTEPKDAPKVEAKAVKKADAKAEKAPSKPRRAPKKKEE